MATLQQQIFPSKLLSDVVIDPLAPNPRRPQPELPVEPVEPVAPVEESVPDEADEPTPKPVRRPRVSAE